MCEAAVAETPSMCEIPATEAPSVREVAVEFYREVLKKSHVGVTVCPPPVAMIRSMSFRTSR
jgi:hypothetical protein